MHFIVLQALLFLQKLQEPKNEYIFISWNELDPSTSLDNFLEKYSIFYFL